MTTTSEPEVPAVAEHACASCGRDAEHDFGGMWVCTDCYHTAGSTCAGVRVARPAGTAAPHADAQGDDSPGAAC